MHGSIDAKRKPLPQKVCSLKGPERPRTGKSINMCILQMGNWGTERLRDLPEVREEDCGRAKNETQVSESQASALTTKPSFLSIGPASS